MKYTSKPITVEAITFVDTGDKYRRRVLAWFDSVGGASVKWYPELHCFVIYAVNGMFKLKLGDVVLRDALGRFSVMDLGSFRAQFDAVVSVRTDEGDGDAALA